MPVVDGEGRPLPPAMGSLRQIDPYHVVRIHCLLPVVVIVDTERIELPAGHDFLLVNERLWNAKRVAISQNPVDDGEST